MSIETYEMFVGKYELYTMLEKGLEDIERGRVKSANEVFARLESRLRKVKYLNDSSTI